MDRLISDYRQRRDALGLFDANCWLGRPWEPGFLSLDHVGDLKAALARYGIQRAVVSHTLGIRCEAGAGNRAAVEAVRDDATLLAAATLVPEMASGRDWCGLLRGLIAQRVRLVRLFPAAHNFLLVGKYLGGMLEALERLRLPLVVWNTQASWPALAGVCQEFPDLPVVVEGVTRKLFYDNRLYYTLLRQHANLYLGTHNLVNYLGLDDLVRQFGSERFIFGSFLPHLDPNAATMLLCEGDMTQRDRENIAHGNLERLLAEVERT